MPNTRDIPTSAVEIADAEKDLSSCKTASGRIVAHLFAPPREWKIVQVQSSSDTRPKAIDCSNTSKNVAEKMSTEHV